MNEQRKSSIKKELNFQMTGLLKMPLMVIGEQTKESINRFYQPSCKTENGIGIIKLYICMLFL